VLGPDNVLVANTLGFLATNYSSTGEYASAEPLILRSLKIKEKALGADSPEVAHDLTQLGGLYLNKGDYLKAKEFDERALDIFERKQMAESVAAAEVLASLGDSYHAAGDYQNAEKYYQRSRAVLEKILGLDSFHLTSSYTSLGLVAYDAGDYPKAEAMFGRALTLGEKALGADSPTITNYLNNLATVYCTTDDYAKGEALYRRALTNHEQKAAMSNPAAQETLFGLARCLAAQERTSEAVQVQTRASEIEERYVSVNLAAGSEREKLAFLANLSSRLSRNISLHTRLAPNDPAARDLSVTTILQRKGRAQDAMSASLSALRGRSGAEDRKLLDQLDDATTKLAQLVLGGAQKVTPAEYQEQIKALEEQREELEAEISRRSAGFYERPQPVTLAAVQAAIPEHAALIEFAVYRPFDPKAPDNQKAYGEPHYVAYVLRRQGEVQWVELGAAQELEARVTAWRQALRDPQRRDVRQLARAVDERLMQPLRALVGDATQLLVSPDGELNLIPFEALVDEQENYLVQRYAVTYLTSGRDLLRIQVARESRSQPLVIADPSFGEPAAQQIVKTNVATRATAPGVRRRSVTAARSLSEVYFAPLRGTAQEARAIKTLFPEANLLTGTRATKAALKQATAPSILHIATHGFFLQDSDRASARAVQMAARGAGANAQIENPLLRSGLALAGANLRGGGGGGGDDGILTALEASSLNLWGTKLVVLSACDTGLGEVHNGEGVYGLRRAFVLAGAESLVMSLWPASDYSAGTLMTNYYTNLSRGLGRGESLRQVQLSMLKRDRQLHPFYWANFIQSGAWTELRQTPRDSHVAPRPHGVD
jgi:CHAT domain-containing protein/Tfp pilus assembly protein PilF